MFRFFENLVDPFTDYQELDNPPNTVRSFLVSYTKPFMGIFIITGFVATLAAATEIYLIYLLGWVIDIVSGDPKDVFTNYSSNFIWAIAFILILRPLVFALDVLLINNTLMVNVATLFRWRAHKHVLRQSIGWFESDYAGRIANRVMQTPRSAGEVVFQVFDALGYSLAYVFGGLLLLSSVDFRLMLPMAVWFLLYLILIVWVIRNISPASKASSDARSSLNGQIVDTYTNIHSVKLFAHQNQELDNAKLAIEKTRQTFAREMRLYTIMDFGMNILNGLLTTSLIGMSLYLWYIGEATAGTIAAASALAIRLNAMTGWIMWAISSFFRELGVIEEGMGTLADPIRLKDQEGAKNLQITSARIEVNSLSHHYGLKKGGLNKLSVTFKENEKVGLVGRSGAGKSTLLKLILRSYDVEAGAISIDSQDISKITQVSLHKNIGVVQQDSSLLHRSIRENICYGKSNANENEIIAAAKKAHAHDFILNLQDENGRKGYDAHVGERGIKLSGGQRQRITLARVILKNAPILLLDEATSALDSEIENQIQDTLKNMMEGKTVIAIAHRLSTIAQMDRILVLDNGEIVEDGDHQNLLLKGGLYSELWHHQSGGFLKSK
jgi:ATP-binding cassette subfamily B multidrug efflux pump|tara:strand:+ start:9881 stop:11710 length:1830 start_codon:yes stop_codon:yes gene_type:complete